MFPYNLLILPLAGGYFFISNFLYFKYRYQRLDTPRVILNSIIAGVIISLLCFSIRAIISRISNHCFLELEGVLNKVPFKRTDGNRYLWTLMFGFLAVISFVPFINWRLIKAGKLPEIISRAVDKNGDELEQLFRDSVKHAQPVQVTLKNEKVYLGIVEKIPEPKKTNYVVLLTLYSGYRKSETKEMVLTTSYALVENLLEQDGESQSIENFKVVIKQDEILTAQPHDARVYSKFIEAKKANKIDDKTDQESEHAIS